MHSIDRSANVFQYCPVDEILETPRFAMSTPPILRISDDLEIPLVEISYRASRSGGPGGQHVNTSSTRVELVWPVATASSLSEEQRSRLFERLANRINGAGELVLAESGSRSQHRNRETVTERFRQIVADALVPATPRRKTKPTKASRDERLREKKHRSDLKKLRQTRDLE